MFWTSSASERNDSFSAFYGCIREKILLSTEALHSANKTLILNAPWNLCQPSEVFFSKSHWSKNITEYVCIWQWHRWAGQAITDSSKSEGWPPSRHPTSFLGPWVRPLPSAQHPFLKEYEKYETHAWVAWWEWIGTDHSQEASTWQAWGQPARWAIR